MLIWLSGLVLAGEGGDSIHLKVDAAFSLPQAEVEERIKFEAEQRLAEHFGVAVLTHVSPTHGEVLFGPTFHSHGWSVNASFGLTTHEMPLRGAMHIMKKSDVFEFLATAEAGGTEPWYSCHGIGTFHHLTFGLLAQRFDGIGPRLGVITHGLEFWAAPMYDYESDDANIVAGFNWTP